MLECTHISLCRRSSCKNPIDLLTKYTHAIASVHGTETVFNPNYCPTETSQALLWVEIK